MLRLGLCALLVACATDAKQNPPNADRAVPLSRDAAGRPRLLAARGIVEPAPIVTLLAHVYVARLAGEWGVARDKLPVLADLGEVAARGGTIARLAQYIDGLPLWNGELHVLVGTGGELRTISGTLVGTDTPRLPARFIDDRAAAIRRAAGPDVVRALAKQVWYRAGKRLVAAWVVDAYTGNGDAFRTILAGADGSVL